MGARGRLFRILGDSRGTAALEFAVIALPLFIMIAGMIETGVLAFTSAVTEAATREAARQVRTGNVQTAADASARFRTEFCDNLPATFSCGNFYFDVRTFTEFASIALPPVSFNADGVPQGLQFAPGGANTVVTVRVIHPYRFLTPLIGELMGGSAATVPLISTAVMRTEPFS
jgi:Flp pilus assembly protein TadG